LGASLTGKQAGAHMIGVDNDGRLGFMLSLGADEMIDYRSQDFTRLEPNDFVLEAAVSRPQSRGPSRETGPSALSAC
jgi:hypothetical protein